ncbi:hypothetical protein [Mammaliicoccus sciuri]|uniref:aldose epimerase family protein n=1 Tax=Mammaliicoccus sciuri TaxID=1296 RepID=UPI0008F6510F|nr:hypothetical protein [Mammaliicoccus sciuri]QDR65113.1 hypothetical protein FPV13_09510 [Mammaliicoccus sciuri]CAG7914728.1 Aldose 1-epimerase [Mammaliicoccus sciuri]SFV43358.1 Hypothetical protein SSCIU_00146 [Mammaliicoccus sciuri]
MSFEIETLDKEKNIDLITIYDERSKVQFTNFGMRIVDWKIDGRSFILGPTESDDLIEYYEQNPYFFGATVARYGGRIENGQFVLNGESYQIEQNDGVHNLHGGSNGLHTQVFDYDIVNEDDIVRIVYHVELKHSVDHFPGDIDMTVTHHYDLTNLKWSIIYEATSTEDTLLNPMNHVYFNLNETNASIENHQLHHNVQLYPLKDNQIVESLDTENINVEIGKDSITFKDIFESGLQQIKQFNGIDHPVKLEDGTFKVSNDKLELEMTTNQNEVVIFTLNDVNWNDRKDSIHVHSGFTLETQSLPNDINLLNESAPSILRNGDTFNSVTSYQINYKK